MSKGWVGGHLPTAWTFKPIKTEPHPKWDRVERSEKDEERDCDKLMRQILFTIINLSQPRASKQTCGIADRLYVHEGRRIHLWWEVKRPQGGVWSADQQAFDETVTIGGMSYGVGSRWDLVDRLNELGLRLGAVTESAEAKLEGT